MESISFIQVLFRGLTEQIAWYLSLSAHSPYWYINYLPGAVAANIYPDMQSGQYLSWAARVSHNIQCHCICFIVGQLRAHCTPRKQHSADGWRLPVHVFTHGKIGKRAKYWEPEGSAMHRGFDAWNAWTFQNPRFANRIVNGEFRWILGLRAKLFLFRKTLTYIYISNI